jgi:FMN-dependent oxidoreductase (nitrilotriacetate monooxygenase family)
MASKPFHLVWFTSAQQLGWRSMFAGTMGTDWMRSDRWIDMAKALERACFDGMIFEDESFIENLYENSTDYYVRNGLSAAKLDPAALATALILHTEHLGIVPTLSTSEYPPYLLARRMNTLDHLSRGRIGWNVVTGHSKAGAEQYGMDDLADHDDRYDMADEYMELTNKLWHSWEADAMTLDFETGMFADPEKVHHIDFEGKYYKSRGPLNNSRSPQGRPVIFQAGGSPRGRDYASRHADGVVGGMTGLDAMKQYRDDLRSRAVAHGRSADDVKAFYMCSPIIGATEREARDHQETMLAMAASSTEAGLVGITLATGVDFSGFDLDTPMTVLAEHMQTSRYGLGSLQDIFRHAGDQTLREFVSKPPSWRVFQPVGTPDQVAGQMEEVMEEVGGDGFLMCNWGDSSRRAIAEVTEGLVPALQRRGLTRTAYSSDLFRENLHAF